MEKATFSCLLFLICKVVAHEKYGTESIDNTYETKASYQQLYEHKPQPYHFGYEIKDGKGNAHFHKEESDEYNYKKGSYGYKDAYGLYRHVDYIADHNGFRAKIRTNEPGVDNYDPADVHIYAEHPPHHLLKPYSKPKYSAHQQEYGHVVSEPIKYDHSLQQSEKYDHSIQEPLKYDLPPLKYDHPVQQQTKYDFPVQQAIKYDYPEQQPIKYDQQPSKYDLSSKYAEQPLKYDHSVQHPVKYAEQTLKYDHPVQQPIKYAQQSLKYDHPVQQPIKYAQQPLKYDHPVRYNLPAQPIYQNHEKKEYHSKNKERHTWVPIYSPPKAKSGKFY